MFAVFIRPIKQIIPDLLKSESFTNVLLQNHNGVSVNEIE